MGRDHDAREYRRNRAIVLATSDVCGICGHPGAITCDHIIPAALWPRDAQGKLAPGLHEITNLQPAHGILHNPTRWNPCPTCQRMCNQVKRDGIKTVTSPRSRMW